MEDLQNLIAKMTLEEKASLCSGRNFWFLKGVERLDIPSIMVTDGPHGLRKQAGDGDHVGLNDSVSATCFPTASALAATWNRDLLFEVGEALGEECRAEQVGVILGPGANIKRSPLCGRNFEYFSEDPYLTGEMAKSHINGVQSQGIGTSLKHFAVNNQEYRRMTIDAVVDERALHEIYLPGYEIAVKEAQPWTVMCAYNRVNGTYCCEHPWLLTDILKNQWGHEGLVVTDWGAMNDRVSALAAGLELEMPGSNNGNDDLIMAAVESGDLDETVLDWAVERILALIDKADKTLSQEYSYDRDAHHALARTVAAEGAVLLKNEGNTLPLAAAATIALIGRFAIRPRYQGAGSSLMNPTLLDNLYDELAKLIGEERLTYVHGYSKSGDDVDDEVLQEAVETAKAADVVVICAGLTDLYETEGLDRDHMRLPPGHDALIQAIAAANPNVVVVLSNGAPVEMPWVDAVPAILEGYLGGQAGAGGVADILTGRVNPSGKLAESFPLKLEDNPSFPYFPGGPAVVEYWESIYVGYRYYDTVDQDLLFPFGHGLSYTTFEYSNLRLSQAAIGETDSLVVTVTVKNIGSVRGQEVVQLYVRDLVSSVFRPEKELKGFAKVELQPGEVMNVTIELGRRAFAYYDTDLGDWHVESGDFGILVGASSRDIRLSATVAVISTQSTPPAMNREKLDVYVDFGKETQISPADFEMLLGRRMPANIGAQKGQYTLNTPIGDMGDSIVGRLFYSLLQRQAAKMFEDQEDTPTALLLQAMLKEMPLRGMLMLAGDGPITRDRLEAVLNLANGQYVRGGLALLRSFIGG